MCASVDALSGCGGHGGGEPGDVHQGDAGGPPAPDELGARTDRLPRRRLIRQHPPQDRHFHLAERSRRRSVAGGGADAGGASACAVRPGPGGTRGAVRADKRAEARGDLSHTGGRAAAESGEARPAETTTQADERPWTAGSSREVHATRHQQKPAGSCRSRPTGSSCRSILVLRLVYDQGRM